MNLNLPSGTGRMGNVFLYDTGRCDCLSPPRLGSIANCPSHKETAPWI